MQKLCVLQRRLVLFSKPQACSSTVHILGHCSLAVTAHLIWKYIGTVEAKIKFINTPQNNSRNGSYFEHMEHVQSLPLTIGKK